MNVTKITTNDYLIITSSKNTDYDKMTLTNCTDSENSIDILIPT